MKNANFKKRMALTLALVMSVGVLAGCGNQQTKTEESKSSDPVSKETSTVQTSVSSESSEEVVELEPVTLKWYHNGSEKEGSADVVEAFNAKLAEVLPNTTVEFTFVESYKDNWPLFMAGGEKIDIAWVGYQTPFFQDVVDGNLLPLTDLMQEYAPNLVEEQGIWQAAYNSAVYEDELYGIPCIQPVVAESQYFTLAEEFYNYVDVDAVVEEIRSTKKLTSKLLDLVEEGIQNGIDAGFYKVGEASWNCMAELVSATRGYMMIGAQGYNMWFDPEAENPVPLHIWEIPETQMLLERIAKWYDKGWITETQVLGQMPQNADGTFGFSFNWNANWANCDERGFELVERKDRYNYYKVLSYRPEEGYIGLNNFGSENTYLAIPYTSENPERAMMLLDLLHDEVGTVGNDLLNMLAYGFEENSEEAKKYGWFNYTAVEEEGQLKTDTTTRGDAASKHDMYNWMVGNTFKTMHDGTSLTTVASKEYAMNYFEKTYPSLKKTALAGMVADYSSVSAEIANMDSVYAEYNRQLEHGGGGVAKVNALYKEAMTRMNEAGLEKVKKELQSQIDAYIAK